MDIGTKGGLGGVVAVGCAAGVGAAVGVALQADRLKVTRIKRHMNTYNNDRRFILLLLEDRTFE